MHAGRIGQRLHGRIGGGCGRRLLRRRRPCGIVEAGAHRWLPADGGWLGLGGWRNGGNADRRWCDRSWGRTGRSFGDAVEERQCGHHEGNSLHQIARPARDLGLHANLVANVDDAVADAGGRQVIGNFQHVLVALFAFLVDAARLLAHHAHAFGAHEACRPGAVVFDQLVEREFDLVDVRVAAIADDHLCVSGMVRRWTRIRSYVGTCRVIVESMH